MLLDNWAYYKLILAKLIVVTTVFDFNTLLLNKQLIACVYLEKKNWQLIIHMEYWFFKTRFIALKM